MTRLTSFDLKDIDFWQKYDQRIKCVLGVDLISLAAKAFERDSMEVRQALAGKRLAAISMSSGDGIVGGFAQSLASIGRHMGLNSKVMDKPDEAGFQQAEAWGAEIVIYANDHEFIARSTLGKISDNNLATSRVFVTALELLSPARCLAGCEVVVLGLGIIGRGAASRLSELGALPLMYDLDETRCNQALKEAGAGFIINDEAELKRALVRTNLIFEAVPYASALNQSLWPQQPIVSAPGVPLAWPEQWLNPDQAGRLWHDPLQSGTAAMLAELALL